MTEPASRHPGVISQDVRAAAYHRLRWLWPILARPATRRALRWAAWGLFGAWLAFAALVLTAVNMFGGFAVTRRMLAMFRK